MSCIFDHGALGNDRIINTILWFSVWDGFPVVGGHALLIPYRHVERMEDLTREEWEELRYIFLSTKHIIEGRFLGIEGYTLGINDGPVAGQTVKHVHLHMIPRRPGDMDDPRGGIRNMFPDAPRPWEAP